MPPEPEQPRPQVKQTRVTGWSWPRLVDVREKKDRAAQTKRANAAPKQVSAATSLRNLRKSRDLSGLREEQSAPTSPTQSPGIHSPSRSISGHRAEETDVTPVAEQEPEEAKNEITDTPLPEKTDEKPEGLDEHVANEETTDENGQDAEHPSNTPGTFPITPAAGPSSDHDISGLGLSMYGLLPATADSAVEISSCSPSPGLAQAAMLPTTLGQETKGICGCGDSCRCEVEPCECNELACHCLEAEKEPKDHDTAARALPQRHQDLNGRASNSELDKHVSPPKIIIQRPSNSDTSVVDDDEFPKPRRQTSGPRTIDSVIAEERCGTERLSLQERLEEERCVTSELTRQDRERIIVEVAKDIASVSPHPIPPGGLKLPITVKVKKRMKVRGAVVRGPVLTVLLGRQLAGPTKQALKMRALGDVGPMGSAPGLLGMSAVGPSLPVLETMDSNFFEGIAMIETPFPLSAGHSPPQQKETNKPLTRFEGSTPSQMPEGSETPEFQYVWHGGGHRSGHQNTVVRLFARIGQWALRIGKG